MYPSGDTYLRWQFVRNIWQPLITLNVTESLLQTKKEPVSHSSVWRHSWGWSCFLLRQAGFRRVQRRNSRHMRRILRSELPGNGLRGRAHDAAKWLLVKFKFPKCKSNSFHLCTRVKTRVSKIDIQIKWTLKWNLNYFSYSLFIFI